MYLLRLASTRVLPKSALSPRSFLGSRYYIAATRKDFAATNPGENPLEARADQLHREIESIVKNQTQKKAQEAEKLTKVAGFTDFLSKHKTNISVIVVSFLAVVLSVKMVQSKQKYMELEKELKETQSQLEEKRQLLRSITKDEFLLKVAENYGKHFGDTGKGWGFGPGRKNSGSTGTLIDVLRTDLGSLIGDAALSEDEINARELEELKKKGKDKDEAAIEKLSVASGTPEDTSKEWVVDVDGKKTVKKSVFRI